MPQSPARRTALLPAVIAVIALMIGLALLNSDGYLVIRFIVSIFALIVAVFAWRARHWWWMPVMLSIAVLWNPALPIAVDEELWFGLQYLAAVGFLVAGSLIRERSEPDDGRSPRR